MPGSLPWWQGRLTRHTASSHDPDMPVTAIETIRKPFRPGAIVRCTTPETLP